MTSEHYAAVVIGSGQGGGPLASAFAEAGHRTALIERADVGGTCINVGCTPTKTMVASARVAHLARRAADYGVQTGPVTVDLEAVRARKRAIVTSFRSGSERRIEQTQGLDLLRGEARFTGPQALVIALTDGGSRRLTADRVIVNTGGRPAPPALPGAGEVAILDSTSIMELADIPAHLIVLGGGYVGLEFGQMFRRFGSQVTIVQRGARLLAREDPDIADAVAGILREDGIEVLLATEAVRVEPGAANQGIVLTVRGPDGERDLAGSHLLAAAGRVPNTDRLDLAAAGVEVDRHGFIQVNDRLETSVAGVWAIGDVKGGPAFTHISYDDFRILRANLLDGGGRSVADRPVPYTVYIDPQLGRIGLSETEAREQGREIRVATMPMSSVARALETDETRGLMKVVVDAGNGQLLGAAILGLEGGELMTMLQLAMMGKLPYPALRDAVFAHPTLAESFNNLFATLDS